MVCLCAHSANAKPHKKKSSVKHAPPRTEFIKPADYPAEISPQIDAYNKRVQANKTLSRSDAHLAKAKADVLKIERESYDVYRSFITSIDPSQAAKISKAVSARRLYTGMPQIAFVVTMGLPDDIVKIPTRNGYRLRLVYKSGTYDFEKSRLLSGPRP